MSARFQLVTPKPFLPREMKRLSNDIDAAFKEIDPGFHEKYRVLFRTQPSIFIDHRSLQGRFDQREFRDWTLYGIVDAAVVERGSGNLILAITPDDTSENAYELLKYFEYSVIKSSEPITGTTVRRVLAARESQTSGRRTVENSAENKLHIRAMEAAFTLQRPIAESWEYRRATRNGDIEKSKVMEQTHEFVGTTFNDDRKILFRNYAYAQVALSEIVDVVPLENSGSEASDIARFAKSTNVDVLVTSCVEPFSSQESPVLVIEFDGHQHAKKRQVEKDKIKNQLLLEAGIPILRVKGNSWFDFENDCNSEFLDDILTNSIDLSRALFAVRKRQAKNQRKLYQRITDLIRDKKVKVGATVLDEASIDRLIDVAIEESEFEHLKWPQYPEVIKRWCEGRITDEENLCDVFITVDTIGANSINELDHHLLSIAARLEGPRREKSGSPLRRMCRALQAVDTNLEWSVVNGCAARVDIALASGEIIKVSTPVINCELLVPEDFEGMGDKLVESAIRRALYVAFIATLDEKYGYEYVRELETGIERVMTRIVSRGDLIGEV